MKTRIHPLLPVIGSIGFLTVASLFASCSYEDPHYTDYEDYLDASGTVLAADGVSKVSGLQPTSYNWVVTYNDGSTVAVPFPAPGVQSDNAGRFNFLSTELSLKSGNTAQSCTDVCVRESTAWEDVCYGSEYTYYQDECVAWDSFYGECYSWDTVLYTDCSGYYAPRAYTYCSQWGTDCDSYYPARRTTDIASAYAEIEYSAGANRVVTQSQFSTIPAEALVSNSTAIDSNNTLVTNTWYQDDTFITLIAATSSPAAGRAAPLTDRQLEVVKAHNLAKYGRYKDAPAQGASVKLRGRSHAPAERVPFEALEPSAKLKVRAAIEAAQKAAEQAK